MYIRNIKTVKMEVDSEIFANDTTQSGFETLFHTPVLQKTTANARLFRVSRSGRYFVIKTTKDNSSRQRELLRREYELSLGCEHPHIVNILFYEYDTLVGEGIVMQYIDGCTLREYLAASPKKAEKRRLFSELLSAVAYLHKRGVVHNDLKPENILVTNNGHSLKLIDFGLASDDAHYILRTPGCTYSYASPELRSGGKVDVRSDVYSLGVIMREMFGASAIAKRCTAALPARRYANVEALQKAWSTRNRKYYILAVAASLVLLLLPSLFYVNDKVKENTDAAMRQQLLMQIEKDVEAVYESVAYDISDEVYQEFANNCIISYWDSIYSYRDRVLQSVDDSELNLLAKNALLQKSMSCCEKLQSAAELLPSFSENITDVKELHYYCTLIAERKPFVPYSGE
ncbi:MAG: serine/threonine protein kinase [Bacteroidaceae bacterium]|nr:serine/threonine protein kinase [Bacteroidaceae bacterium]